MKWRLEYGETRLEITSDGDYRKEALEELVIHYDQLAAHIVANPIFKASYEPVETGRDAPKVARMMADAASECGVGPMAAVAGAFAQLVGERLVAEGAGDIIVENGGDIYVKASAPRLVRIHAGPSPLSDRFGLKVPPEYTPCGICTSSASVGPSISLGASDSTTVAADSAALADAAATAIGNLVGVAGDFGAALDRAHAIRGVRGAVIIAGDSIGARGALPEIVELGR
jgi:uncharacterized protein